MTRSTWMLADPWSVLACVVMGLVGVSSAASSSSAAVTVGADHTCGKTTGATITYTVSVSGSSNAVDSVCFPQPRFQREPRPVLSSTGSAGSGSWTATETTVNGLKMVCFTTSTTPITSGSMVAFTVQATLDQSVGASSGTYRLEGGGLRSGRSWYRRSVGSSKYQRGGTTSAVNGSGPKITSSLLASDVESPDHMICDPPEFGGASGTCASIVLLVVDDQDPSPQVQCTNFAGGVSITATDSSGNTDSSDYTFFVGVPTLSAWGRFLLGFVLLIAGSRLGAAWSLRRKRA